jgi:outer membrane protein OmpA-like peptidoglycan-associated protein
MLMKKAAISIVSLAVAVAVSGCTSTGSADGKRSMTNTEKGALIGVLSGAAIGAASTKKRGKGALIGAVGGGLAGTAVGSYMDRQKQDLEKNLQSERDSGAVKIEKLPGDVVKITMTSQTAFDSGSASLKPGFGPTMDRLAKVVVQYEKTELTVIGHTDSDGSTQSNQDLSQRRAQAVTDYLKAKNVNPERLDAIGKGELEPLEDNRTEAGKRANRRVEILVEPVRAE